MVGILESWQPQIFAALLALVVGICLEKYRNRKPDLFYYLLSASSFEIPNTARQQNPPAQQVQVPTLFINTHSIVIQNGGKVPATNVEVVHHRILDSSFHYRVAPDVPFTVDTTPGHGLILRFPNLLPGHAITISYLYTSPLLVNQIHNYVNCHESAGYAINVLSVRQTPKWLQYLLLWLGLLGLIYLTQLFWIGFRSLIHKAL